MKSLPHQHISEPIKDYQLKKPQFSAFLFFYLLHPKNDTLVQCLIVSWLCIFILTIWSTDKGLEVWELWILIILILKHKLHFKQISDCYVRRVGVTGSTVQIVSSLLSQLELKLGQIIVNVIFLERDWMPVLSYCFNFKINVTVNI